MKRSEQKEMRRRQILNVGLDLFIQMGFAATRTADIACAVGMSEGLLFHYFETKEKLYAALIELALSKRENAFQFDTKDPLAFFETVADYILTACSEDRFFAKLFVLMNHAENDTNLSIETRQNIKGQRELDASAKLIRVGQQNGSIKKGDPLALASVFWVSLHGVVENMVRNPELPLPSSKWIADIIRNV